LIRSAIEPALRCAADIAIGYYISFHYLEPLAYLPQEHCHYYLFIIIYFLAFYFSFIASHICHAFIMFIHYYIYYYITLIILLTLLLYYAMLSDISQPRLEAITPPFDFLFSHIITLLDIAELRRRRADASLQHAIIITLHLLTLLAII